jgi:hypothetical protein
MIFGVNFGAPDIPVGVKRHFRARISITGRIPEVGAKDWMATDKGSARLVGTATTRPEMLAMLIQATNGNRSLYVVERMTAGGTWFGIYAY